MPTNQQSLDQYFGGMRANRARHPLSMGAMGEEPEAIDPTIPTASDAAWQTADPRAIEWDAANRAGAPRHQAAFPPAAGLSQQDASDARIAALGGSVGQRYGTPGAIAGQRRDAMSANDAYIRSLGGSNQSGDRQPLSQPVVAPEAPPLSAQERYYRARLQADQGARDSQQRLQGFQALMSGLSGRRPLSGPR